MIFSVAAMQTGLLRVVVPQDMFVVSSASDGPFDSWIDFRPLLIVCFVRARPERITFGKSGFMDLKILLVIVSSWIKKTRPNQKQSTSTPRHLHYIQCGFRTRRGKSVKPQILLQCAWVCTGVDL